MAAFIGLTGQKSPGAIPCNPGRGVDGFPNLKDKRHIRWDGLEACIEVGGCVLGVASTMGIDLKWGGHWKKHLDFPHYYLVP